jgi:uncharacterized damage-inducible protein DinB
MTHLGALRACFHHNDWAFQKVLSLAEGLSDEQLDRPVEMGPGTLRETLRHHLGAERFWFSSWRGDEQTPVPHSRELNSVSEIRDAARTLAATRDELLAGMSEDDLARKVTVPREETPGYWPLGLVLLHVCNHGIHHRAQALNMLRQLGVAVPGLDYLFMRVEQPTVAQDAHVVEKFRASGLAPEDELRPAVELDVESMQTCFRYGDWAQMQMLERAGALSDEALDRPFEMGVGTLRATLTHTYDAEFWWFRSWTREPEPHYRKMSKTTPIAALRAASVEYVGERDAYIASLSAEDLKRVVRAYAQPDMRVQFRLGETMLELCGHGTHHRAQALNMLRHVGAELPKLDMYIWAREQSMNDRGTGNQRGSPSAC